jgi:hypothetical protein
MLSAPVLMASRAFKGSFWSLPGGYTGPCMEMAGGDQYPMDQRLLMQLTRACSKGAGRDTRSCSKSEMEQGNHDKSPQQEPLLHPVSRKRKRRKRNRSNIRTTIHMRADGSGNAAIAASIDRTLLQARRVPGYSCLRNPFKREKEESGNRINKKVHGASGIVSNHAA